MWHARRRITNVAAMGGSVARIFDPSNKSANLTLSGGNLISTAGGGSGAGTNVRDTVSHSTGKYYAEFTITTAGATPVIGIGLVNGTFAIGTDAVGGNNNSIGYYGSDGHVYINNVAQTTQTGAVLVATVFVQGDVVQIAADMSAKLFWIRKNGAGFWNNDTAPADPATGANGVSFSALGSGPFYAAVEQDTSGQVVTANFGGTAYSLTPPTGYGNW